MGLLCDLFVTTRERALAYETSLLEDRDAHLQAYSPEEFKGLTSLEFGMLWAILENQEWDVEKHMLIDVAFGEGDESWLHQFQDEYVALLAALDEERIGGTSQAWGETEELQCPADDIRPVVEALARLSREALAKNQGLFMWGSL